MSIRDRLDDIGQRMQMAEARAGRPVGSVRLLTVTKTVPAFTILEALGCGVTDIGENRVQEAATKFPIIGNRVRWHLIGHLQANKVRKAVELFDVVQTVDTLGLAERLDAACVAIGKPSLDVLLQVNVDSDDAKSGMDAMLAPEVARAVARLPRLRLKGLMTIGRLGATPDEARRTFRMLAELAGHIDALELAGVQMTHLSMGMSGDFEAAIEEGSTMVRVGSSIFGERVPGGA